MYLCSKLEGPLPSRMIAAARSRIVEVPVSPAAHIISTTMPDKPADLPSFITDIYFLTFLTVSKLIGTASLPLVAHQTGGLGPS